MTAWPRAPDTGCHLEINQQSGPEPTNQKLLLHLLNSHPFPSENPPNLVAPVLSTLYVQLLFYSLSFSFIILDGFSYPLAFNDSSFSSFLVFSHNWTIHTCKYAHTHTHTYKNTQMCDHSVFITMKSANNEIPGGLMVLIGGHPVKNPTPPSLPSVSMHRHIPLQ